LNEGSAIVVGALALSGETRSSSMNVIATSTALDQSMTIMTSSESQDAILYLGTPFNTTDAARKTALIAEGLGFYSENKFHICLNGESVNGEVGNATLADSHLKQAVNCQPIYCLGNS
jgi:hypothetical protein